MNSTKIRRPPKYYLGADGKFVIEQYNYAKPFADFFPGIAGKYGIPMWAFFVNRGQAIASFGIKDKDHAISEFYPANKSWQQAPLSGFRTFIKMTCSKKPVFYEPFHNGFSNLGFDISNAMSITSYDLSLEETNATLGLKTEIRYFTVPGDSFAALARIITLKNTSKAAKKIQLIDGLPQIIPFGMNNFLVKELGRTLEAWMAVHNLEKNVPFFKLAVDPKDTPEVVHIDEGNFYLGFHFKKEKPEILKPIVDPDKVFGPVTDLTCPYVFIENDKFVFPSGQMLQNKTPCGFIFSEAMLAPQKEKTFYSLVGYTRDKKELSRLTSRVTKIGYLAKKSEENKLLIEALQSDIHTESSSSKFDLYAKQTYLDNILRGGYPVTFPPSSAVFHLYSRKHGDLERDYNRFVLAATYFSQGNGSYRDVNQNRRLDVWFNPEAGEENILTFLNLIQLDGFNPLVVKGASFSLADEAGFRAAFGNLLNEKDIIKIIGFLMKPFTPGEVVLFIRENNIRINCSLDEFLGKLLSHCKKNHEAEHGEGFWTDHWTYNLDLLENYFAIYPEKIQDTAFSRKDFTYFDNSEIVKPRSEKYQLYNGLPRQLHSITVDSHKKEMLRKRAHLVHTVRRNFGEGQIYKTNLFNKLVCLALNKASSLDPFGVGIEMEANKPNWYDALNGLPALFGSSSSETFELKRLLLLLKSMLSGSGTGELSITEELSDFLFDLKRLLKEWQDNKNDAGDFEYWDKSASIKESFRKRTLFGVSGNDRAVQTKEIEEFLDCALEKVEYGIAKAWDSGKNLYYTYFINEVAEFQPLASPYFRPKKFRQKPLPFFLESQMHALRVADNIGDAKQLYESVRKSSLFDKKIKNYKVNTSLKGMPEEIGRCRVFTPGWLENESIWLHMEYKYMLEILKLGLFDEFYRDFKNVLVPFKDAAVYGRSILENSSFIVSSVYPDKNLHGNGFVARLSGSTAEFLQIWAIMNAGRTPFFVDDKKKLNLEFSPALPGWLFNRQDKTYKFNFLGKVKVIYHNPSFKNTFGKNCPKIRSIAFKDKDNKPVYLKSSFIPPPFSEQVRSRLIKQIDIYLD